MVGDCKITTQSEFVTVLRGAKKVLLANSSVSIKDIAMMVGYSNARYFSSLFKQSFNILPSAYRKQYLEK